jgi:hypothetical protein
MEKQHLAQFKFVPIRGSYENIKEIKILEDKMTEIVRVSNFI